MFKVFIEVKCPVLKQADSTANVTGGAGSQATFLSGNLAWPPARKDFAAPVKQCAPCNSHTASDPCRWATLIHSSRAEPCQRYKKIVHFYHP